MVSIANTTIFLCLRTSDQGIPDNKNVMGFWILAVLSAMAGLATLKLR